MFDVILLPTSYIVQAYTNTRCARLLFLESIVCIVILKQQVNSIIVQEQHYKRKTTYIRFLYAKIRPFEYTRMVGYFCPFLDGHNQSYMDTALETSRAISPMKVKSSNFLQSYLYYRHSKEKTHHSLHQILYLLVVLLLY